MKGFVHCCFRDPGLVKVLAPVPRVEMTERSAARNSKFSSTEIVFSGRYQDDLTRNDSVSLIGDLIPIGQ